MLTVAAGRRESPGICPFNVVITSDLSSSHHIREIVLKAHQRANHILRYYYYYFFDPGTQFPGKKNYAIQRQNTKTLLLLLLLLLLKTTQLACRKLKAVRTVNSHSEW